MATGPHSSPPPEQVPSSMDLNSQLQDLQMYFSKVMVSGKEFRELGAFTSISGRLSDIVMAILGGQLDNI